MLNDSKTQLPAVTGQNRRFTFAAAYWAAISGDAKNAARTFTLGQELIAPAVTVAGILRNP
ncbi:MAG TPA: hypothetical protein VGG72_30160 [Bryobacteraceae bacterium]|jgi:hypothetical protein